MLGNWIKQTTTNTGTPFTLASVTGFDTFNSQFGNSGSPPFRYFTAVFSDGNNWQTAVCHMTSATVLAIDQITMTFNAGTMTRYGAALTLSGGATNVFCDYTVDYLESPAIYLQTSTTGVGGVSPVQNAQQVGGAGAAGSATGNPANFLLWHPFRLPMSGLYSGINWHFSAVAGTAFKYAIYSVGTDGNPNRVLCQIPNTAPATGDHYTAWTGGNTFLERGDYYLGYTADGTSSVYTYFQYGNFPGTSVAGVGATGSAVMRLYLSQAFGAFPDPYADAGVTHDTSTIARPLFSLARTV